MDWFEFQNKLCDQKYGSIISNKHVINLKRLESAFSQNNKDIKKNLWLSSKYWNETYSYNWSRYQAKWS